MSGPGIPDADAEKRRELAMALWNVRKSFPAVPMAEAVWQQFASEAMLTRIGYPDGIEGNDDLMVEMNKAAIRAALEVIKAEMAR